MLNSAADHSSSSDAILPSFVVQVQKREETYKHILLRLFLLLKVKQDEDPSQELLESALTGFHELLKECLDKEGSLVMNEQDGFLFLNGVRSRVDLHGFSALKYLVKALRARSLTGIMFESGVEAHEIQHFLDVFILTENGEHSSFSRLLAKKKVTHIHAIIDEGDSLAREFGLDRRMLLKKTPTPGKTYFKRILVVKYFLDALSSYCPVAREETHQLMHELALGVLSNESYLQALDDLSQGDRELYSHCVTVAVISLALGVRIGLSDKLLHDLGIAALFHELGAISVEPPVDSEAGQTPSLRSSTFRRLLFCTEPSDRLLRSVLAIDEHLDDGIRNAPEKEDCEQHVTSILVRILDVANAYDVLVMKNMADAEYLSVAKTLVMLESTVAEENREIAQLLRQVVVDQ